MRHLALLLALATLLPAAGLPAAAQQPNTDQGGVGAPPVGPPGGTTNQDTPPPPAAAQGCADPTFSGKYSGELRRLNLPGDAARYGRCRDYGPWSGNSYAGYTNLPNGFWVYSYPQWIIYAKRGQ